MLTHMYIYSLTRVCMYVPVYSSLGSFSCAALMACTCELHMYSRCRHVAMLSFVGAAKCFQCLYSW